MIIPSDDQFQQAERLVDDLRSLPRASCEKRFIEMRQNGCDKVVLELASEILNFTESDYERIGKIIDGNYQIEKLIASGGMGDVYKARQIDLDLTVAIKFIKPAAYSPRLVQRFQNEMRLLAQLEQTDGIARVYWAGQYDGAGLPEPFLVMEYIEGRDLEQYAKTNLKSDSERLNIVARLCESVHAAHLKGFVHCDIKPSNILVDKAGSLKLLDFGIAMALDDSSLSKNPSGFVGGTPPWIAPEQARGLRPTCQSDVYSLGVILYQLLTGGRLPYNIQPGRTIENLKMIGQTSPTPISTYRPKLSKAIQTVVEKAMAQDLKHRYESAAEFRDDLIRITRGETPSTLYDNKVVVVSNLVNRNRIRLGVLAIILFIFTAACSVIVGQAVLSNQAERNRDEFETLAARYVELSVSDIDSEKDKGKIEAHVQYLIDFVETPQITAELEQRLREILGRAMYRLRNYGGAAVHHRVAVELANDLWGTNSDKKLYSVDLLCDDLYSMRDYYGCQRLLIKSIEASNIMPGTEAEISDTTDGFSIALRLLKLRTNLAILEANFGRPAVAIQLLNEVEHDVNSAWTKFQNSNPIGPNRNPQLLSEIATNRQLILDWMKRKSVNSPTEL